jgi:hypothetical protein
VFLPEAARVRAALHLAGAPNVTVAGSIDGTASF